MFASDRLIETMCGATFFFMIGPRTAGPFGLLTILDEYTRECLALDVARRMSHRDVMDRLAELFIDRGVQECLRSDHGSEFTAQTIRGLAQGHRSEDALHRAGQSLENGYVVSFNGKLRDELLNREVFETLRKPKC